MRIILQLLGFYFLLNTMACAQPIAFDHQKLANSYSSYKEKKITDRRFKHRDIEPILQGLKRPFSVEERGQSIEGRAIYTVSVGSGDKTVLLWSQMHGDESTATMALFDIFKFLAADDGFNDMRDNLLRELKIVFIPMLNPDGAERFQRRNALGVDLNRDALRLESPESRILKQMRDELDADWGFNLHDQSRYYAAGNNPHTAALSFLAPAYNYEKEVNANRERSMRLIGEMNAVLQQYIPGKVGRYNDAFEPRAFGDNIQKWGTSTILIETGGLKGDLEKQELRKLNFISILTALHGIAEDRVGEFPVSAYDKIPFNESNAFHDVILREVQVQNNGNWYTVDVGIRRRELGGDTPLPYFFDAYIHDLGDLSTFFAYESIPARGKRLIPGKIYPKVVSDWKALKSLKVADLWQKGYTTVRMDVIPARDILARIPLKVISAKETTEDRILPGQHPALILQEKNVNRLMIINGMIYDLSKSNRERLEWWKGL
ncbi:MAG: hypothetical protein KTR30_38995 [Saprospiraceae bacterium]|nr:hypothetical protein [Saprospiraceae bacterium]